MKNPICLFRFGKNSFWLDAWRQSLPDNQTIPSIYCASMTYKAACAKMNVQENPNISGNSWYCTVGCFKHSFNILVAKYKFGNSVVKGP